MKIILTNIIIYQNIRYKLLYSQFLSIVHIKILSNQNKQDNNKHNQQEIKQNTNKQEIQKIQTQYKTYLFTNENKLILQKLNEFTKLQYPVLIVGPQSSGKYTFVNYFSNMFINEQPILINLSQDDIYGQFSITSTPGVFIFSKSILTTAIETGKVICCKNIENLSIDSLSNINQLLTAISQNKQQFTVQNQIINIHKNFRLFLTCKENSQILKLIGNNFYQIHTTKMAQEQIVQIINNQCQKSQITQSLLEIQNYLNQKINIELSLQQLIDVTRRIERDYINQELKLNNAYQNSKQINALNQSDKLLICLEIYERCILQLNKQDIQSFITQMSILLRINVKELEFYLENRKVNNQINLTKNELLIGRTKQYRYKNDGFSYNTVKNLSLNNYTNNLMEKIIVSLQNNEKPLLIAKTGIGKTYTLGLMAKAIGQNLTVVNLSRNTDVSELTGGWKPSGDNLQASDEQLNNILKLTDIVINLYLDINNKSNQIFYQKIKDNIQKKESLLLSKQLQKLLLAVNSHKDNQSVIELQNAYTQLLQSKSGYSFTYIEGQLIQAAYKGNILLLDEINMANNEVLQYIQYFISNDYIDKFNKQTGQVERQRKHPNFKIVAAMNPGSDIGKKELPQTLKQMFTSMNLQEMSQDQDLLSLIETYIGKQSCSMKILNLFKDLQQNVDQFQTISQQSVCYSIRQLCRVLMFVQKFPQQIYTGFMLYFGSQLNKQSKQRLIQIIKKNLGDQCDQNQRIQYNTTITPYLLQDTFLVNVIDGIQFPVGPLFNKQQYDLQKPLVEQDNSYIITDGNRQQIKSVLLSLISGTSLLLQGVTSSGKSSVIKYLSKLLGYPLTRLNNHQNTELSDYIGTYQPTPSGTLKFQYGPLIQAMRKGEWILLDELNLCSSEILESLNRLLDDNHELVVTETNEIFTPKTGFALFGTQNPSGVVQNQTYGGRNALSDAFVNRFNLIEFNEASPQELKFILQHRRESALLPEQFIDKIISVCDVLKFKLSHVIGGANVCEGGNVNGSGNVNGDVSNNGSDIRGIGDIGSDIGSNGVSSSSDKKVISNIENIGGTINGDITPQITTLRDVFKIADSMPDSILNLARVMYIVLCERQRSEYARLLIQQQINKVCNVQIDQNVVQQYYSQQVEQIIKKMVQLQPNIAITSQLEKMVFLGLYAHKNKFQLLLISEAGCGKTQAVQLIQSVYQDKFNFINLHKNSDSGELIGQIRPVENQAKIMKRIEQLQQLINVCNQQDAPESIKQNLEFYNQELQQLNMLKNQIFAFEYGPIVQNIFTDQQMLLDEINLANDAVIERLNSLFEYDSELMLQETNEQILIKPSTTFSIISTMNPGNDYGKKELSPAMRSRMLEVCINNMNKNDIIQIIESRKSNITINNTPISHFIANFYIEFKKIIQQQYSYYRITFSIRDIIMLFNMIIQRYNNVNNINIQQFMDIFQLTFFDGLKMRCPQLQLQQVEDLQQQVYKLLNIQQQENQLVERQIILTEQGLLFKENNQDKYLLIHGNSYNQKQSQDTFDNYVLNAPTTQYNAFRVAACISNSNNNNIIIESDPGVGKTSLIQALANITGNKLIRINLSEHVELSDLLGQEIPSDDKNQPFRYQIGPLSQAIIDDCWVLLDEINLANQQVLEGLNSLLDYRGSVFIPEIQQKLNIGKNFKLFAAQNSPTQKAGRKQLPQSFMNRFLTLYLHPLTQQDYKFIIDKIQFQQKDKESLLKLLLDLQQQVNNTCCFIGGPWEVNIRDLYRLYDIIKSNENLSIKEALLILFLMRFRTEEDYISIYNILTKYYPQKLNYPLLKVQSNQIYLGQTYIGQYKENNQLTAMSSNYFILSTIKHILNSQIPLLLTTTSNMSYIDQLLQEYSQLSQQDIITIDFSKQTDVSQIVGQYTYKDSRFVWEESILVQALQNGNIVHIKNANFCSYAVLDRLNSLLERNGTLTVFESGFIEIIRPHKDFRIILSYNSDFQDVSAAIRNRCVEICVSDNINIINQNEEDNQDNIQKCMMWRSDLWWNDINDSDQIKENKQRKQYLLQQLNQQYSEKLILEAKYDELCNCGFRTDNYNDAIQISLFKQKQDDINVNILFNNAIMLNYDSNLLRQQSINRLQYIDKIFKQKLHKQIIQNVENGTQNLSEQQILSDSRTLFDDLKLLLTFDLVFNKNISNEEAQQLLKDSLQYVKYSDILYCRQIIQRMINKQQYEEIQQQIKYYYNYCNWQHEDLNQIKGLLKSNIQRDKIMNSKLFEQIQKQNIMKIIKYTQNCKKSDLIDIMIQHNQQILEQFQKGITINDIQQYQNQIQQLYNYNVQNWNITQKQINDIKQCIINNLQYINKDININNDTQQIKQQILSLLNKFSFSSIMDKSLLNKNSLYIYNTINKSMDLGIKCLIECNCVKYGMKFIVDNELTEQIYDFKQKINDKIDDIKSQITNISEQSTYIQYVHELTKDLDKIIQSQKNYSEKLLESLQNLVILLIQAQNYIIVDYWFDISLQLTLLCMLVMISIIEQIEQYINELSSDSIFNTNNNQVTLQYIIQFAQNVNQNEIQQLQYIIEKNSLIKSKYEQEVNLENIDKDIQRIFKYDDQKDEQEQQQDEQQQIEFADNKQILQNCKQILQQYEIMQYKQQDFKMLQQNNQQLYQLVNSQNKEWEIYSIFQYLIKQIYQQLQTQQTIKLSKKNCSDIYNIPNIQITLETLDINNNIESQVQPLLDQYEESQVLINIKQIIKQFRNQNCFKFACIENLKELEQLYRNINDWNQNAPQKLQIQCKNVQNQIVKLRKLELFSWDKFKQQIQDDINDSLLIQLPQLIVAIIKACQSDQYEKFDSDLLTSFLQLQQGQVIMFDKLLQFLIKLLNDMQNSYISDQIPYVKQVKLLLQKFYCKIKPVIVYIQQQIEEKEKPIVKKFIAQIKLFKYDIRNFYRLRDDVEASHRMIVKLLSQYKDIRQLGVYEAYQQYNKQCEKIQKEQIQTNDEIVQIFMHFHDEKQTFNQQQLTFSQLLQNLYGDTTNSENNINLLSYQYKNDYICCIIQQYYKIQQLIATNNVHQDVQPKVQQITNTINSLINQLINDIQELKIISDEYNYESKQQIQILQNLLLNQFQCIQVVYSYKLPQYNTQFVQTTDLLSKQKQISKDQFEKCIQLLEEIIQELEKDFNQQIVNSHKIILQQIKQDLQNIDFNQVNYFTDYKFTQQDEQQLQYINYILKCLYAIIKSGYLSYQPPQEQKEKQQKPQNGIGFGDAQADKDITQEVKQEELNDDQLMGDQNQQDQQNQSQSENDQKDDKNVSGIEMDNLDDGQNKNISEEYSEDEDNQLDREMTDQQQENLEQADQLSQSDQIDNKEQVDNVEGNQNSAQEQSSSQENESMEDQEQLLDSIQSEQQSEASNSLTVDSEQFQDNDEEDSQNHELSNLFDDMFKEDIEQQQVQQEEQDSITFDQEQLSQVDQKSEANEEQNEQDVQQFQQNDKTYEEQQDEQQVQQDEIENSDEFKADIQEEQQDQQGNEQQDQQNQQKKQNHQQGDKGEQNEEEQQDQNEQQQQQVFEQKQLEEAQEDDSIRDAQETDQGYVRDDNAEQQMKIVDALEVQEKEKSEEKSENSDKEDVVIQLPNADIDLNKLYYSQETQNKAFLLKTRLNVILAPTEASQLIGDFKTGKKLNMRRMVQFFASNFRKDKIWLRRQKAEEKKYNIIMAIDNSFSIQQQPQVAEQLLQSLFIIQKAFKDFGQIQTYTFGDKITQIQQENEIGVYKYLQQIQQKLTFNDKTTDFKCLFETIEQQFKNSVLNTNNIFILLTDGRINANKIEINALYRQLTHEYRVMPIMILFDSSLFKLQSVKFIAENGKIKIEKISYFEDEYPLLNYFVCEQNQDIVDLLINAIVQYLSN